MSSKTMKYAVALVAGVGAAGAIAIVTASPSWAAPVASNAAAVKTAASTQLTDVRYYRRHYYGRRYYYGPRYYRRGYAYPYWGYRYPYARYTYPYSYPYSYSYPYLGFGFGWGRW